LEKKEAKKLLVAGGCGECWGNGCLEMARRERLIASLRAQ
jgi:hypothetical protein